MTQDQKDKFKDWLCNNIVISNTNGIQLIIDHVDRYYSPLLTQRQIIEATDSMCIESCSPAQLEAWENLKKYLIETRKSIDDESPDSNQEEQKNIWLLALDYLIDKMRYWRDNNMQSNIDEVVDYYKSIYIINKNK